MVTLYSSQTIPANGGLQLLPTTQTLSKSLISLHAKVTTGAALPTPKKGFQLVISATPFVVADSDGPNMLHPTYILYCEPVQSANGVMYFKSDAIVAEGQYLHAWIVSEALGQAVTLDAQVMEIA